MTTAPAARRLSRMLSAKQIVVACGPGGVGKTTTAAALAAAVAVREAAKVLVVTVDPARRLADALGLEGIGDEATRVAPSAFEAVGVTPKGELWAAMLDTKRSWDALVCRHAPDAATAREILANPLYRNLTGRFAQSHEYIAMERLYEIHAEGRYDLVVVDTPPAQGALDLLDAPEKMADFFSSRLLRWLTAPVRSRLVSLASRPFYQVADRALGSQFLEDIARFFLLFQSMYEGFVERAEDVQALLRDPQTTFMVVTTPETVPILEATRFVEGLAERHLDLGLLVANKVLPDSFGDDDAERVAAALVRDAGPLAEVVVAKSEWRGVEQVERVLAEVGASFANFRQLANRQAELLDELARAHDVTVRLPHLMDEVIDLAGLIEIGRHLYGD